MPPTTAIKSQHCGLKANLMRRYKTWSAAATALGLLPWEANKRYRRQALCVIEAWHLHRSLGRWPIAKECSSALRRLRYERSGLTWETALCVTLPSPIQKRLMVSGYQHLLWLRRHLPAAADNHQCFLRSLRPLSPTNIHHSSA
jgi:hypothetical protein